MLHTADVQYSVIQKPPALCYSSFMIGGEHRVHSLEMTDAGTGGDAGAEAALLNCPTPTNQNPFSRSHNAYRSSPKFEQLRTPRSPSHFLILIWC